MAIVQGYTKTGVDKKFASRSHMTLVYSGTGTPELSAYPDAKTGDIIERSSDRAQWRVLGNTLTSLGHIVTKVNGKTGEITIEAADIGGLNISTAATANYIVRRTTAGNITVPKVPNAISSATSKFYVDSLITGMNISIDVVANYVVKRTNLGNINVPLQPFGNGSATSKKYVDDSITTAVNEAKVWVGTQVQYNALSANDKKRVCIITTA